MKRDFVIILVAVIAVLTASGVYSWYRTKQANTIQNEEVAVRTVVNDFGHRLKNISLLSPTAGEDILRNYNDYVVPDLLSLWENNPSQALGRLTSSPWPDRIEIDSVIRQGADQYSVKGKIIELTSTEVQNGGIAATQPIELEITRLNNKWLISSVNLDP